MVRFICPQCQAEYAVARRRAPADREPTCERCDRRFPDEKAGGWLHYWRADTQREVMQRAVTA
jgi:hypothetical protein